MVTNYIKEAIKLAKLAKGMTSPNPLVGVVIVKDDRIVGSGYHKKAGSPHAEINAINNAKESIKGAALYVNLEPCSHYGRTPPCVDAIIKAGIKEVYVGMIDPNPLVSGKGVQKLRENGIKVTTGILQEECERLNENFVKFITQKIPFVILKSAATLDGRTATAFGDSKWITNEKSRRFVHKLRSEVDAVLVGSGTLMADDPFLTVRLVNKKTSPLCKGGTRGDFFKNPIRVILDRTLKIKENANVLSDLDTAKTIIFVGDNFDRQKADVITKKGAKVIQIPENNGELNLKAVLKQLGAENITSVLVEGGEKISSSFVRDGLADKLYLFLAPKILLDSHAKPIFSGTSKGLIKDAISVKINQVKRSGEDVMIEIYL